MNIEAIVAIVTLVVAIPPTAYVLYKWYGQRQCKASLVELDYPFEHTRPLRRQSQMLLTISDRTVIFGLTVENGGFHKQKYRPDGSSRIVEISDWDE